MSYESYTAAEILRIEDRVRTVADNLRAIRELAEESPSGTVRAQLASCDPLLKRLESLSFNAVAASRASLHKDKLAASRLAPGTPAGDALATAKEVAKGERKAAKKKRE